MSGKYQTYPEYKDSGVRWLGSIPANWQVKRVKHLTTLNPSKSEVRSRSKDEHVSFIPMEAIGEQGELDASGSRLLGEVLSGYTYVADGDVMLAKITPCFENGKAAVATGLQQGIGFATTEVIPVRPNDPEDAKFFYYLLTSMPFKAVAEGSMYGAGGQKRVADSFVAEYHLAAPPSLERTQIAAFLDHETARIDRLIEKQQRLIELLKEKRQAVISHAVTKGLDPNVPMKDSGVEWLGQVPEHWRVVQARHLIRLMEQGKSPECEARTVENDEWGVLKTGCVNGGIYRASEHKALPAHITPHIAYEVQPGDILMSRASGSKDLIGAVAYVDKTPPRLLLSDKVFRLILETGVHPKFFTMLMGSKTVRAQVELAINGAEGLANNITKESIKSFVVALPSHAEQRDICEHLSQQSKTFAKLEGRLSHALMLLQERRTALISAAVTGKIDVRNWRPDTSTQIVESDLPMAAEQAAEYQV